MPSVRIGGMVALALCAGSAYGAPLRMVPRFGAVLDEPSAVIALPADLSVDLFELVAPKGIRREGNAEFVSHVPLSFGDRYEVRSSSGRLYRVTPISLVDGVMALDVDPVMASDLPAVSIRDSSAVPPPRRAPASAPKAPHSKSQKG